MAPIRIFAVILAGCLWAAPGRAQYMYLDVTGDGISTQDDMFTPATPSVDVWLDTNHDRDGSTVVCNASAAELTISSYSVILRSSGNVTFGGWSDNLGFALDPVEIGSGQFFVVSRGSAASLSAGLRKLGTLSLSSVSPGATLSVINAASIAPSMDTSFGTACEGVAADHRYSLGQDWFDVEGIPGGTTISTQKSTWGEIKLRYR